MTTNESVDSLLATLDETVKQVLAYFEGQGSASKARVGEWGAFDVLCHFVYWHEATSSGMESVAGGGAPFQLDATADELNAGIISENQGKSFIEVASRLRDLQERLKRAARSLPDLDSIVLERPGDLKLSGRDRLEIMNRHWARHVAELQAAEPS